MDRAAWNARYAGKELVWSAGPNRFLVSEAGGLPPGRALDLACGEGRNAIWLAEQGFDVTGVDFSDVALDRAVRISAERGVEVEWLHADVTAYAPPADTFALVVLLYLHLPWDQMRRVLGGAAGALARGGTLLVV